MFEQRRINPTGMLSNSKALSSLKWVSLCCAVLAVTVMFQTQGFAKVYHVDVTRGNDGYPGTEREPYRTIRRASAVMEPGDKTIIHPGIYHEQILGGKSGREGAPITYEGTDPERVILRGSVLVKDWRRVGQVWMKGFGHITEANAFVMVDEKRRLQKVHSSTGMPEGSFFRSPEGIFSIRLWGDANPNTEHAVELHQLDFAFNAGDRYGGTAKNWIILRNMTIEKYYHAVSSATSQCAENSHWELDRITFRYNTGCGIFSCLDDWYVHDSKFIRNGIHGCQVTCARVRFEDNLCQENEWFGHSGYGGMGLLIGADESAHSCVVRNNTFVNDGYPNGYGCAIYLEGKCHDNLIENNFIYGAKHAGIGFYGGSYNTVINNVLVDISPQNAWELTAGFVVGHSREGPPTQSVGNLVAHNTVWGCAAPVAIEEPNKWIEPNEMTKFVNNLFANCRIMLKPPKQEAAVFERNGWFSCPEDQASKDTSTGDRMRNLVKGHGKEGFKKLDRSPIVGIDPKLRNTAARDFHLKSDSPLVNSGISLDSVKTDRDGNPRPIGSFPDVGAYEHTGVLDRPRE